MCKTIFIKFAEPLLFLIWVVGLSGVFSSTTFADTRSVTQWRPYLEWSLSDTTWSGNPYDVQASVAFQHTDTGATHVTDMFYAGNNVWMWRFTATLPGQWTYLTSAADTQLSGLSGTVNVTAQTVNGFYQQLAGDKWAWQGTDQAVVPNYVMLSNDSSYWDTPQEVDALINEYIVGHGFTGFHVPHQGAYWFDNNASSPAFDDGTPLNSVNTNPDADTFSALELLLSKTHASGGAVHIWLWGDRERDQNLTSSRMMATGGANGVVDQRLQRYIAARLGPLPGWSIGYGFDLFEWTDEQILTTWANDLNGHLGWPHFLGARGNKNVIATSQISENLDYTAYEQHVDLFDFDDWLSTMADRPGKPSFTEDRFRIRNENRSKDLKADGSDTRTYLWEFTMAGGLAAIWGNLIGSSNEGSVPYPNKTQLKTFSIFWNDKQRFKASLNSNSDLSSDIDTRILVNNAKTEWVLYRRDSNVIQIDLSGAPEPLKAIAVNTKSSYAEISLGELSNAQTTISLPFSSDWAIYISDSIEAVDPPSVDPNSNEFCFPIKSSASAVSVICL